jgi:CBS domain-containing protein
VGSLAGFHPEEEFPAAGDSRTASGGRGEFALFVRRVRDLLQGPALTCQRNTTIGDAARLMSERGVGSVIVTDRDQSPIGIVTDRDFRTRVLARGLSATTAVSAVMSAPLIAIGPGRLAFDALLEMTRANIHHLGVVEDGRLLGVVSSHDFMLLQGAHPVVLVRQIQAQGSVDGLVALAAQVPIVIRRLAREGVGAFDLGRLVAEFNDRLVRRTLELTEAALAADGRGGPPVPYSWLALGSEGRREQTFKTDQDNGLVYEDPSDDLRQVAAEYFAQLGQSVGAALVRQGFPLCPGGYMASNPRWCQPAATWRDYFTSWMASPHPQRLLDAAIFFDLRPVAGQAAPGEALWAWVCDQAPSQGLFLRYMAWDAVSRTPPLGLFGRLVVERAGAARGRLDLKGRGVFPMTQAMRAYALSLGLPQTNTVDRLLAVGQRDVFSPAEVTELRDAYEVVFRIRMMHQIACVEAGRPPDNLIDPSALSKMDRLLLREAFRSLAWLQKALADRFQTAGVA